MILNENLFEEVEHDYNAESLNEAEAATRINVQGISRPTSYKNHRLKNKPLSVHVYDELDKMGYEVFTNSSLSGYTITKFAKRNGDSVFIRDEKVFNRAIEFLNNLGLTYKIEDAINGVKKLIIYLPEEDEDEVINYFSESKKLNEDYSDEEKALLDKFCTDTGFEFDSDNLSIEKVDVANKSVSYKSNGKSNTWHLEIKESKSLNEDDTSSDIIDNSDDELKYQLLDRLRSDCEYYLGEGNRSKATLWAGDPNLQIMLMRKLWQDLPEKPEWLTAEKIDEYEKQMTSTIDNSQIEEAYGDRTATYDGEIYTIEYDSNVSWDEAEIKDVVDGMRNDGFAYFRFYNDDLVNPDISEHPNEETIKNNFIQEVNKFKKYAELWYSDISGKVLTAMFILENGKLDETLNERAVANPKIAKQISDLKDMRALEKAKKGLVNAEIKTNKAVGKNNKLLINNSKINLGKSKLDYKQGGLDIKKDIRDIKGNTRLDRLKALRKEQKIKLQNRLADTVKDNSIEEPKYDYIAFVPDNAELTKVYDNIDDARELYNQYKSQNIAGVELRKSDEFGNVETLTEDIEPTELISDTYEVENNGLASIVNNLIQDEWQAIQGYKDAIVTFETEGKTELTQVLEDILDEENIHVGQLQTLLTSLDNSADKIAEGEAEAAQQLSDNEESVEPVIAVFEDLENKDKTRKCSICGKDFVGYGNNAEPINDGICCDECNANVVIPERIKRIKGENK